MKITLFMAMSVNGVVADKNGSKNFLSGDNWRTFLTLATQAGAMIYGRRTYEVIKTWELKYLEPLMNVTKIIVSGNTGLRLESGFILAYSPEDAIKKLEKLGGSEAILSGGGQLNSSFLKAGLVDEIILNIEGVIIGEGIPVFAPVDFQQKLELIRVTTIKDSLIQVHYALQSP